jgi:hypothetical protein
MNNQPIVKGSVVLYKNNHYRVSAVYGNNSVNLAGVWGGKIQHKRVSLNEVVEDHDNWHTEWTKSEHYMCM